MTSTSAIAPARRSFLRARVAEASNEQTAEHGSAVWSDQDQAYCLGNDDNVPCHLILQMDSHPSLAGGSDLSPPISPTEDDIVDCTVAMAGVHLS